MVLVETTRLLQTTRFDRLSPCRGDHGHHRLEGKERLGRDHPVFGDVLGVRSVELLAQEDGIERCGIRELQIPREHPAHLIESRVHAARRSRPALATIAAVSAARR